MIDRVFPPTGGTPWDDLEADRPWFDECAEADYLQDRQQAWDANPPAAADVALERFGALVDIVGELPAPLDDELTCRRRQHILNTALEPDPSIIYRRGSADRARTPDHRDLAG